MNADEAVDDFLGSFGEAPGVVQRQTRQERARKEKRTQLTEKQRKRGATRTVQFNFRCSQECKDKADNLAKRLDCSIPDLIELLIESYEKTGNVDAG